MLLNINAAVNLVLMLFALVYLFTDRLLETAAFCMAMVFANLLTALIEKITERKRRRTTDGS